MFTDRQNHNNTNMNCLLCIWYSNINALDIGTPGKSNIYVYKRQQTKLKYNPVAKGVAYDPCLVCKPSNKRYVFQLTLTHFPNKEQNAATVQKSSTV